MVPTKALHPLQLVLHRVRVVWFVLAVFSIIVIMNHLNSRVKTERERKPAEAWGE